MRVPQARVWLAVLIGLALGSCSVAPRRAAEPLLVQRTLANGTRLVVQPFRQSEVVAIHLWVGAGGRDESPAELGLAHYLEHMLFKGTAFRPSGFVEREIEAVGGRMNAGTSLDYTYYHALVPADRAAPVIELLADITVNSTLDETALELEKKVVLEEMRRGEDNPRRSLVQRLYGLLFDGHQYGRPVIGTPPAVQGLTRETLVGFYRRHYVPHALALVVVGPVEPASLIHSAERAFGRIPRGDHRRLPVATPGPVIPRRVEVERPGSHAWLGIGWRGPRLDHADTPAVDLLASILGQSRAARLTQGLRERLGIVNSVSSAYTALEGSGALTVVAQLDPANRQRAEQEVLREVRRLRDEGVTEAERRRAVTAADARHSFSIETVEGRAYGLGRALTVWRVEDELFYLDRLRTVTREQIQRAAQRYLDPEAYVRFTFVPPGR